MGVVWLTSVVRSRGVAGLRGGGMVVPTDEAAKVASMDQFFYFILECFAFFRSVTMVAVVPAIFGHVGVGRCGCLAFVHGGRWVEVDVVGEGAGL